MLRQLLRAPLWLRIILIGNRRARKGIVILCDAICSMFVMRSCVGVWHLYAAALLCHLTEFQQFVNGANSCTQSQPFTRLNLYICKQHTKFECFAFRMRCSKRFSAETHTLKSYKICTGQRAKEPESECIIMAVFGENSGNPVRAGSGMRTM